MTMTKTYKAANVPLGLELDLGQSESWAEVAPNAVALESAARTACNKLVTLDVEDLLTHWTLEYRYPSSSWAVWSKAVNA
jgi:hypothetical protein